MESKAHQHLVEWTVDYLKNKDVMLRKIELIEKNKYGFDIYVKSNDKEQFFIVKPVIDNANDIFSKLDSERHFGLVVLNTAGNLDVLVKRWDDFAKIKGLAVYFVNPFSQLDKRWIVYPYTHNSICERGSLERGLKAMSEMVEPLTEGQIKDTF